MVYECLSPHNWVGFYPLYLGLSPFPVIVEMKVYRDSLLKMITGKGDNPIYTLKNPYFFFFIAQVSLSVWDCLKYGNFGATEVWCFFSIFWGDETHVPKWKGIFRWLSPIGPFLVRVYLRSTPPPRIPVTNPGLL